MFKKFLVAVVVLLQIESAIAESNDLQGAFPSNLAVSSLLTDIIQVEGRLIAVGERGHIIYSDDGQDWQQAQVPVNVLLTSVAFKNKQVGFATGHDATLLKTVDGGETWQLIHHQPELDRPLLDVIVNNTNIIAVGAYGLFLQSKDGGDEWQLEFHEELVNEYDREYLQELKEVDYDGYLAERQFMLPHFNSVAVIGNEYFMVGEAGFVATSVDSEHWERLETDYIGSYFAVIANQDELYLAGLRGNVFASEDGGSQWQPLVTPVPATVNNAITYQQSTLFFANSGNLFVATNNNEILHHTFSDGKAVMAGAILNDTLYLATESGVHSLRLSDL